MVASAAKVMPERHYGFVPVIDRSGAIADVLTDRDACACASNIALAMSHVSVRDAMARPVVSCFVDDNVKVALSAMADHHVRRLPVLDKAGRLHDHDAAGDAAVTAGMSARTTAHRLDAVRVCRRCDLWARAFRTGAEESPAGMP